MTTEFKRQHGFITVCFSLSLMDRIKLFFCRDVYLGIEFIEGTRIMHWKEETNVHRVKVIKDRIE